MRKRTAATIRLIIMVLACWSWLWSPWVLTPHVQRAEAAQACAITMDDSKITNDPTTSQVIALPDPPCKVTITGKINSSDPAMPAPFVVGVDSFEKIINVSVNKPTVVSFEASFTNKDADVDAVFVLAEFGRAAAAETDLFDSSEGFGPGGGPETIPAHVLLPGKEYFYALSNFECERCGEGQTPIRRPETDYTIELTVGGDATDVSLEAGAFTPSGILGRFTSGNGRLEVNRFSIGADLGLTTPVTVEVIGFRYLMGSPERFQIQRKTPVGDFFDLVAFSGNPGPNGEPPNNPTGVITRRVTIRAADAVVTEMLDPPIRVPSNVDFFAGMFLDRRDPGENNVNLGRNQIILWQFMVPRTENRTWATTQTTIGGPPVLSGWQKEVFSSGGVTSSGPLWFRIIVRVPQTGQVVSLGTDGLRQIIWPKMAYLAD